MLLCKMEYLWQPRLVIRKLKPLLFVSVLLCLCLFKNTIYLPLQNTISYSALHFAVSVVRASNWSKNAVWETHTEKTTDRQTETGADVCSSKEMRRLAHNRYLPWMLSVMKILHGCRRRGVRQKSQLALSATEGGVNKGIACLFMSRGGGGPACLLYREWDGCRYREPPVCSTPLQRDDRAKAGIRCCFHVTTQMCLCWVEPWLWGQRQAVYLSESKKKKKKKKGGCGGLFTDTLTVAWQY